MLLNFSTSTNINAMTDASGIIYLCTSTNAMTDTKAATDFLTWGFLFGHIHGLDSPTCSCERAEI